MTTFGKVIAAAAIVLAVLAGGCGDNTKCPSESPRVDAVASCFAPAGSTVNYQLRLCPTCNQNLTGCTVDMSGIDATGGTIFLNPVVEACGSSASCGAASCLANPTCAVTVPSAPDGTVYTIEVHDPASNGPKTGTLTVAQTSSCTLPG